MDENGKKEMQTLYMELQMLDQQIKATMEQIQMLDSQDKEIILINQNLEDLKNMKAGKEVLIPINNGIFIKGEVKETDKMIISIGAGVAVEKTIPETKIMLDGQLAEVKKIRVDLMSRLNNYTYNAQYIEKQLQMFMQEE